MGDNKLALSDTLGKFGTWRGKGEGGGRLNLSLTSTSEIEEVSI